jgi:TolB-like protein/DNA-binding winged helix-turn-helix (wHTH) protein
VADRAQTSQLRIGAWLVTPALDQIERAGDTVKLEPRTMRLLLRLSEAPGEVVSGQQLLDDVWTGVVVSSQSVYQAISQLRKLLGDVEEAPTYIATVPRKGYRLVAPVERLANGRSAPSAPGQLPQPASTHASGEREVPPASPLAPWSGAERRAPAKRRGGWIAAAIVVVLAAAAWPWIQDSWRSDAGQTSVVVLPFVDMTEGHKDAAFTDGITEELSTSLSQLPALRVIARTSAYAVSDQKLDARQIGEKLSATHIVEGTVRRSGDVVRVTAQLVDAQRGHRSWSEVYDLPAKDLLRLQTDLARSVAQALEIRFSDEDSRRLSARRPGSAEAFERYLLARHYYRQRTPEANDRAMTLAGEAIELDPEFALAYVGLAQAKLNESVLNERPIVELRPELESLLATALRLNPDLAEAYATRGQAYLQMHELDLATRDFAAAARLDRNNITALAGLGLLNSYEGKPLAALGFYDQAAALDPLDFIRHVRRCVSLTDAGKYALAEQACLEARRLKPDSEWPYYASSLIARARGDLSTSLKWNDAGLAAAPGSPELLRQRLDDLENIGLLEDARALVAHARALDGAATWVQLSGVGVTLLEGRAEEARRDLEAVKLDQDASAAMLFDAAALRLMMHDAEEAERLIHLANGAADAVLTALLNSGNLRWGFSHEVTLAAAESAGGRQQAATQRMQALLRQLDQLEANGVASWGLYSLRADALAIIGNQDAAVIALQRAVELGWRRTYYVRRALHFEPMLGRADLRRVLDAVDKLAAAERSEYRAG